MKGILLLLALIWTANICIAQRISKCALDTIGLPHQITKFAEIMPQFPGGEEAFGEFLNKNLAPLTKDYNNTYAEFILDTLGAVKGVCILYPPKSATFIGFENKVLYALKRMPNWTTGVDFGKKVAVQIQIPLKAKY